ncbi:EAL domain-containing protein [Idiomarina aminovorans]|uniref:EAL domain-containing protein n=1 Tax=Idiomarina aminovorans TaxID=2914829 RepID=UPI0020055BC8|nr:EAL domain-containing protein [Idiomarina sp. ATCH4]
MDAEKQVFIGFVLAIFIAAFIRVIEMTGGLPNLYEHLLYFPLVLTGLLLGPRIGALAGLMCGILLSPFSFSDTVISSNEIAGGWVLRLLAYTFVATFTGIIARVVKNLNGAEQRAKFKHQGTDLPNIHALLEQLKTIGNSKDGSDDDLVDIFNFRLQNMEKIQQQVGTEKANELVKQMAIQLKKLLGDQIQVGQTSKNELVGVSADAEQNTEELQSKIENFLEKPIVVDGVSYQMDSAAGVLRVKKDQLKENHQKVFDEAQAHAFNALQKKQQFSFLEQNDDAIDQIEEITFSRQFSEAMENDDIQLYYQPRLNTNTGYFSVLEVSAKWVHPKRGGMNLNEFKPMIEEASLTQQFTSWMLQRTFNDLKIWQKQKATVRISINITINDTVDPIVLNVMAHELQETKCPARNVYIEVSERALMSLSEKSRLYLEKLRSVGCNVIAAHFGEGRSTIQSLFVLPVDAVKLSEELVQKATSNSDKKRELASMVKMARARGLTTIATGINDRAKLLLLKQIGCEELQGSILSQSLKKADIPWARMR